MNFVPAIVVVAICSLFFLVAPIVHFFQNRSEEIARQISIDSISSMVGLLGLFSISALLALHRRISAMEKAAPPPRKSE